MAKKRPFYEKFRRTLYETVSDSGNSVLRYRGHDNKEHYVASSEDPDVEPSGGGMVEVKWQELKDKRDAGELTAGTLYRITDYNCTTTQENTRSAGHQFDIVLLALSNNKLAEEGWAMMHDNIYDVTFADGVTKKCWIYKLNDTDCNIVKVDNLLGIDAEELRFITIDETNKTAIASASDSSSLIVPNLTYNYFQNSNLSAWKVWYCLDNDKSRFAWADDSVDEGTPANITSGDVVYVRDATRDDETKEYPYGWISESFSLRYTQSATPNVGDAISPSHDDPGRNPSRIQSYTPAHEGTGLPNGRGVIYRLIDEFNNDVAYDFKNIQFNKRMLDSTMWCYTFTKIDDGGNLYDCSTYNDGFVYNNFIERTIDIMEGWKCLSNNVLIHPTSCCIKYSTNNLLIESSCVTLINSSGCEINNSLNGLELITCHDFTPSDGYGIYINNKKVLTEE